MQKNFKTTGRLVKFYRIKFTVMKYQLILKPQTTDCRVSFFQTTRIKPATFQPKLLTKRLMQAAR
jgi:hypothetical protein